MPSFYHLPRELMLEILQYLDAKSLLRCSSVCTSLRDAIRHSVELQYIVELFADGMVDGIDCRLTPSERLARLLELRARWRSLEWAQVRKINAPWQCQAYELVDSVFASSRVDNMFIGSRHLALTWLPTPAEGARRIEWQDMGFILRDFAMDPSQDLLALVLKEEFAGASGRVFSIALRQISQERAHPNAARPMLQTHLPSMARNTTTQIVDDVIGSFFFTDAPGLLIWNWRTGEKVVSCVGFGLSSSSCDFTFVSDRAFMVTLASEEGSIELYTFKGDAGSAPSPVPEESLGEHLPPTKVAQLCLPATNPGRTLGRAYTHSGPFVAQPTPGRPFETARDNRIHMFSLHYSDHSGVYAMFVHDRYFQSVIQRRTETDGVVVKQWDEWGPDNTRFVSYLGNFVWLRYIHGARVVFPPIFMHSPGALPQSVFWMFDFNVHPKRRNDPALPPDSSYKLEEQDSVIDSGQVFVEAVVSRLPYAKSSRVCLENYSGFMIDQEHLIGLSSDETENGDEELDVYIF